MSAAPKLAKTLHQYANKRGCRYTELGNAERLAIGHGDRLRYVPAWGWLMWDGKRWARNTRGAEVIAAKDVVREMYVEAASMSAAVASAIADSGLADLTEMTDEQRKKGNRADELLKWARSSSKASAIAAMLKLAQSEPPIGASPGDFDRDRYLLNVENGTLDLRTGQLRPHRQEDMITRLAPVDYDPAAPCDAFERFLELVQPEKDVREWLQRFIGYALTGDVSEHVLMFTYGMGANGKSTLLEILLAILGDYAKAGAPELLLAKHGEAHPTEVADLDGARLVVVQEIEEGRKWAIAALKRLTGGDRIKARMMRQDFYEFDPTHKFAIAANTKPEVEEQTNAMWRRMRLVPFAVTIAEDKRDKHFARNLLASERAGVLAWAVRGCLAWQAKGLKEPESIKKATAEYREDQDVLGKWIDDRCVVIPEITASMKSLYEDFETWCECGGRHPWKQDTLRRRLVERAGIEEHRNKYARGLKGIALRSDREELRADPKDRAVTR